MDSDSLTTLHDGISPLLIRKIVDRYPGPEWRSYATLLGVSYLKWGHCEPWQYQTAHDSLIALTGVAVLWPGKPLGDDRDDVVATLRSMYEECFPADQRLAG